MPEHDSSYKSMFSHPRMVADLLSGFVHEPWVSELDLSTLERVAGSYVSDDLRDRYDDIIWRLRWRDRWLYLYLLLEFQSTVDPFMALRILVYVGLLYQDLVRTRTLTEAGRLPPVLPIVLYNGRPRWTAPEEMADLVEPVPGRLADYQPRLRYLLLEESRYGAESLDVLHNLAAGLIALETSRRPADAVPAIEAMAQLLRAPEHRSLERAIIVWLRRVWAPARVGEAPVPPLEDLQEVKTMLAERVIEWTREWKEQGLAEGRQEGRQEGLAEGLAEGRQEGLAEGLAEGRQEGEAAVLTRLMELRFGQLDESVRRRVAEADAETLLRWTDRVLTADRPEDVVA
ncbi:MAG: Rpn family recombination-promoting nuclease/putative transposase [Candidatus Latescibacterota bacterium]